MKKHSIHSDLYEDVIAELRDDWRVALSISGTEWILQNRREKSDGKFRWEKVRAHKVRADLLATIRHCVSNPNADAMETIHDLPERLTT